MSLDGVAAAERQEEKPRRWDPMMREWPSQRASRVEPDESEWHPLAGKAKVVEKPDSEQKPQARAAPPEEVFSDPLSRAAASRPVSDPLSAASDPLTAARSAALGGEAPAGKSSSAGGDEAGEDEEGAAMGEAAAVYVPWVVRKTQIVQKFTTTGTIQMPSFVSVEVAKASRGGNTLQARVDSIDDGREDEVSMVRYNAREYVTHMTELNEELIRAWNNEERVKALKMAIQCSKLLGDSSTPQFYPSLFVLVTEVLDSFGRLVFERIKQKGLTASGKKKVRVQEFEPSDVTDEARETCKNWFYKIASIRELIPRLFMEMAIIRCYQFLHGYSEYDVALVRLAKMVRGIADPQISIYARAYLVRKCHDIDPRISVPLRHCFTDSCLAIRQVRGPFWAGKVAEGYKLSVNDYCQLLHPAVDYILACLGQHAERETCMACLREYAALAQPAEGGDGSTPGSALVLAGILSNFKASYLSGVGIQLTALITAEVERGGGGARSENLALYGLLGRALVESPPAEEQRLPLLNEIWKHVAGVRDVGTYMDLAVVYVEYVCKYFGDAELGLLLNDVVRHVAADKAWAAVQGQLRKVALNVLRHRNDLERLMGLEAWASLIDLIQGEGHKEVDLALLRLYNLQASPEAARDPVMLHLGVSLAKSLHDSITTLSTSDERREVQVLIAAFVDKVDFGADLEKHLNFVVDARRFLANLDGVTKSLVMSVLGLIAACNERVKMKHTRRTMAFVKACLAFAHVTIPAVATDKLWQLHTFLLAAQVALSAGLLSQSESLLKAALGVIPDLAVGSSAAPPDAAVLSFIPALATTLLATPAHPDGDPLLLVKALLNAIREHPWEGGADQVLFAADEEYALDVRVTLDAVVDEAVQALKRQEEIPAPATRAALAASLLNRFLATGQLTASSSETLWDLFSIALRGASSPADRALLQRWGSEEQGSTRNWGGACSARRELRRRRSMK
ncbi:hypothetical protein T484DRAFT_1893213 [Baffinella frigidus]|nr:hypothetical protein T484DRAFT_1893213 [Cryptophyta sp. CCMP2293]